MSEPIEGAAAGAHDPYVDFANAVLAGDRLSGIQQEAMARVVLALVADREAREEDHEHTRNALAFERRRADRAEADRDALRLDLAETVAELRRANAVQRQALLAERDEALSSLEELAESAETYRQAVEGRVAVLEAALRDLLDALVNSPPSIVGDPWATKVGAAASRARAVLEVANYREPRPARAQPDSRVVVEGE